MSRMDTTLRKPQNVLGGAVADLRVLSSDELHWQRQVHHDVRLPVWTLRTA